MNDHLRKALMDLVWFSPNQDRLRSAYRNLEYEDWTEHEREVLATVFNLLVHHFQIEQST